MSPRTPRNSAGSSTLSRWEVRWLGTSFVPFKAKVSTSPTRTRGSRAWRPISTSARRIPGDASARVGAGRVVVAAVMRLRPPRSAPGRPA